MGQEAMQEQEQDLEIQEQDLDQEIQDEELEQEEPKESEPSDEEAKARRMGWVPREEYRGDQKRWVTAEEFIRRGENELPILRERLRKQDETIAEMQAMFKEFKSYHEKTAQRAYEKAARDLASREREAVESADVDAFDAIQKEKQELQEEFRRPSEEARQAPVERPEQPEHPYYKEWLRKNEWYGKDQEAHEYANHVATFLAKTRPDLVGKADFMEAVTKEVKVRFPKKFENVNRNSPPAVETGGVGNRSKKKSYADLPANAKAACDKYVGQGLTTREQYVKDYYED